MEDIRYYELKADIEQSLADDLANQIVQMKIAQERHQHRSEVFKDMLRLAAQQVISS